MAYFAAQEAIFADVGDVDLSAYRFQLNRVYHVAVLGDPPPTALHDAPHLARGVGTHSSSIGGQKDSPAGAGDPAVEAPLAQRDATTVALS